jgi:hypothetical protein
METAFLQSGDFVRVGLRHLPRAFLSGDVTERRTAIPCAGKESKRNNENEQENQAARGIHRDLDSTLQ